MLTNKYAEGYPGKRYYGGCEHVDVIETLAIERVKDLFGAELANVQPHSGRPGEHGRHASPLLEPGDTILGMNLAHGGHLTHGMKLNFSGKLYKVVPYGVDEDTHPIDIDQVARLAREHRPKLIIAGWPRLPAADGLRPFRAIAKEVGASSWWTWPISRAWSPPACTPPRSRTPTWSPRPPTRPSPARAAASS